MNFSYDKNDNKLRITFDKKLEVKVFIWNSNKTELIYSTTSFFDNNTFWYAPVKNLYDINNITVEIKDLNDNKIIEEYLMLNKESINYDNFILYKGQNRNKIKCFIINYNRLTLMKNMADYLYNTNIDVYIIDNNSTYESLLKYYDVTRYNVIRMNHNYEYKVFWTQNIYNKLKLNERYLLTDSDLDLSGIPSDFLNILEFGLDLYPEYDKCGLSLRIDDLPDTEINKEIREWEYKNWNNPLDNMFFKAEVDTTFALYKVNKHNYNGIRTNVPYCVRHIPWYYTDKNSLPEDEKYYFDNIKRLSTFWSDRLLKNNLIKNKSNILDDLHSFTYDISINKLYISSNIDMDTNVSIFKLNGELVYSTVSNFEKNTKFWCVAPVDLYEVGNIRIEIKDFNGVLIKNEYMVLKENIIDKNWKINFNI